MTKQRRRMRTVFLYLALSLLTFTGWMSAQTPAGSIEGTVTDSSGAVVAGAAVTASNPANGVTFNSTSNEVGLFRFPVVPVGTYNIVVSKDGFGKLEQKGVVVNVGGKLNLPLTLGVQAKSEDITVTGEIPVVETTRTQVSSTINERAIHELPVNGRNFLDFALLTPGVTRDVRTGDLSFAGQRGTLNSLTVDGADNNNTFFGQTTGRTGSGRAPYQFSNDSVQEFQINSNAYSAELGRAGGAVINVVTKSGTNDFHGTGFWFYRDQSMNAYDPTIKLQNAVSGKANGPKPKYHFNQFGGTFGGPIMKNKMFFFFNYDGQRNSQPNTVQYVIPTKPAICEPTPTSPCAPAFTPLQSTNWDTAVNYLNARSASYTKGLNQDTYMLKYDWNLTQKNQFSFRWNRQSFTGLNYENGIPTNALEHTGDSLVHSDTFTSSLTSTLSNNTVNVFRFTYLKDREPGKANSNLPEAVVKQGGQTILTVGRNSFSPRETTIHRQQYADTLSYVRGRHTLKVGGDAVVDKILNFFPGNFSGAYTFNSLDDFGASLNGVATSTFTTYAQAFAGTGTSGPRTNPDMLQASWFIQDDWRASKNLTINVGLRYDIQLIKQPSVTNNTALNAGYVTSRIPVDKNNVAPRIGFAWSPLGNDKWVFRGGYGMFYGNTPSIMIGTAHSNNGINVGTLNFNGTSAPTYPNTKCGAPVDSPNCPAPTGVTGSAPSIFVFSQEFQQPLIQQANFGTEYAVTPDVSVAASYLWVKADHLQRTRDVNLGTPTPQTITFAGSGQTATYLKYGARPIAAFQRIGQFESTAASVYNGMNLELKKRFSRNFQGSAAYTWSHVIDTMPDATAVVPFSSGDDAKMISDPKNIAIDRASGVNDQRHRFTLSWVWEMKYGQKLPSFAKAVLGGWDLSGVFIAQSGQPYSGTLNSDLNNDSNRQSDRTPGTGRNSFRMPSTWTLDPRLTKNVQISEGLKLQAFVEAFNLFNRFNVVSVRTQQYAVSGNQLVLQDKVNAPKTYFGMPTSPLTPNARILQLGAKLVF